MALTHAERERIISLVADTEPVAIREASPDTRHKSARARLLVRGVAVTYDIDNLLRDLYTPASDFMPNPNAATRNKALDSWRKMVEKDVVADLEDATSDLTFVQSDSETYHAKVPEFPAPHDTPALARERVLDDARKAVVRDRETTYGSPENNFGRVAAFWSAHLDLDISSADVAVMLGLLKIARIGTGGTGHYDNWVDLAGYAACGAEVAGCTGEDH